VVIDSSQTLARSLDLAENGARDLVIIDSHDLAGEVNVIANEVRSVLPAAGIFALTDGVAGNLWQPDGGLDGVLPRTLDEPVARGFLYSNFLRPLVSLDGMVARAAGFLGPSVHLSAYVGTLARVLVDRCLRLDPTADPQIDLSSMPAEPDAVVAVIAAVNSKLRAAGAAPAFQISPSMRAATAGRLACFVIL
jgi:hypothetical protein